jgi:hypothetical protein
MTCTGLCPFESLIGNGFGIIFGNPLFLGLILIGLFGAFVMLQGGRLDAKIVVLVPIGILALLFIPGLIFPLAVAVGVLIYLAIMRMIVK